MIRALFIGALAAAPAALAQAPDPPAPPPTALTFEALVSRARPDPTQLRVEADLAARQRQLAATGGFLREGPTLTAEGGTRRGPLATGTDKVAQVDLPLLLAPSLRTRAQDRLDQAQASLLALARVETRHHLRRAYLDAWLAAVQLDLRQTQVVLTQAWVRVAEARVASGADPAFQADLVQGDLVRLQVEASEAERHARDTWGVLRSLADLPSEPQPLVGPGLPALPGAEGLREAFQQSLIRRAQTDRAATDRAAFELQEALRGARWSLKGSYAAEGDERITRLGVAYRLPRAGELAAQQRGTSSGLRALTREAELAMAQLDTRFDTALARLLRFGDLLPPRRFEAALRAVDLRLQEGKERPSEALLLRRQLLEAENASLQRLHAAHLLAAELDLLTFGATR